MDTTKSKTQTRARLRISGGYLLATSCPDLFIARVGSRPEVKTPADQTTASLLPKLGRALSKPGVSREAVFGHRPKKNFYIYSLDPTDPNRMVREDFAGNKTIGRIVNGSFRKVPAAR